MYWKSALKRLFKLTKSATVHSRFSRVNPKMSRYFANPYVNEESKPEDEAFDFPAALESVKKQLKGVVEKIVTNVPPEYATLDGGLYVGSVGIAYAFLYLSQRVPTLSTGHGFLNLAHQYLRESLNFVARKGHKSDSAFLLGDAGIHAVSVIIAAVSGEDDLVNSQLKQYLSLSEPLTKIDIHDYGSDEFFVGRTGYLFGALCLNKQLQREVIPVQTMHSLCEVMVESGRTYSKQRKSPCPLMYAYYDTEYLGAAHGLASILQVLIQVPNFLDTNPGCEKLVRSSVDYLLSVQTHEGNFPCTMDELHRDELVHWCHGAPGVVYLMAAAYLRWKDARYLDSCIISGELVWHKGLLKKGPGLCHGVAGSGYVFLLLYRLTSNKMYLRRAVRFAEFMTSQKFMVEARTPDCPFSLYEGLAGTACFLADLCEPDKAAFPFQDVF